MYTQAARHSGAVKPGALVGCLGEQEADGGDTRAAVHSEIRRISFTFGGSR